MNPDMKFTPHDPPGIGLRRYWTAWGGAGDLHYTITTEGNGVYVARVDETGERLFEGSLNSMKKRVRQHDLDNTKKK